MESRSKETPVPRKMMMNKYLKFIHIKEYGNEYIFHIHFYKIIRTSGIEPESRPWKGGVLPLYYMRVVLVKSSYTV